MQQGYAQLQLASRVAKQKARLAAKPSMKRVVDISLSNEMIEWIQDTFEDVDEEGYMRENIGSMLTRPLDSMSMFCPVASIVANKSSAPRIPNQQNTTRFCSIHTNGFNDPNANPSVASLTIFQKSDLRNPDVNVTPPVSFQDAVNRLDVLWLQRQASLEREDGDLEKSFKTLDKAIDLHLGTKDYLNANLADHVVSSDPAELLVQIEENYLPYDITPHYAAGRIQTLFLRYHRKKTRAANLLCKLYRGYLARRTYWRWKQLRGQSAQIIQHRFRIHLHRVHMLATRIKTWYRLRCTMRDYYRRLYYYRMARRIQRLWRGVLGRRIAGRLILRLNGCRMIQRNFRGYRVRGRRFYGIFIFQKLFYCAARIIQRRIRVIQAIKRSQIQLIKCLTDENLRIQRERELYSETIRIETDRTKLYLKTAAGRLHVADSVVRIGHQDDYFEDIQHSLPIEDVLAHDAIVSYELFDSDGSGKIHIKELKSLLFELCFPIDDSAAVQLAIDMGVDNSGNIDFNDFLDWYSVEGIKKTQASLKRSVLSKWLSTRKIALDYIGVNSFRRAERDVLRQCCVWLSRECLTMYRFSHPPKYQCCRCMSPFALFTDYYVHFDANGTCLVTGQKGLYFKQFWVGADWKKQRMIEREIIRVRDEFPYTYYRTTMAIYSDMALQQYAILQSVLKKYKKAAKSIFYEKLKDPSSNKKISDLIMDTVNITKEDIIQPSIAKCVARCLGVDLPRDWIAMDRWEFSAFKKWIISLYGEEPEKTSAVKKCLRRSRLDLDAELLSNIHVLCIRCMIISSESALVALKEYRTRRPRRHDSIYYVTYTIILISHFSFTCRMSMITDELEELGLQDLTLESYISVQRRIVRRLKVLNGEMQHLIILSLHPRQTCKSYLLGLIGRGPSTNYAAVGTSGGLSPEIIRELEVTDAHIRAAVKFKIHLKTRIGKTQIKRLAAELWASQRHLQILYENDDNQGKLKANMHYLFDRYSSPPTNEGVDIWDLDLLEQSLSLKIPEAKKCDVFKDLDQFQSGTIELDSFLSWIANCKHDVYKNIFRFMKRRLWISFVWCSNDYYCSHGRERLLASMRKITRLEVDLHNRSVLNFMKEEDQFEIASNILQNGLQEENNSSEGNKIVVPGTNEKIVEYSASASTVTKKKAKVGDTKLEVRNLDGFVKGMRLVIGDGSESETTILKDIDSLVLESPLTFAHPRGATVIGIYDPLVGNLSSSDQQDIIDSALVEGSNQSSIEGNSKGAVSTAYGIVFDETELDKKLSILKADYETGESRLIFRNAENDAEWICRKKFLSRQGRYQLRTEKMLMQASSIILEAYGYCISPGALFPSSAVKLQNKLSKKETPLVSTVPEKTENNISGTILEIEQHTKKIHESLDESENNWLNALAELENTKEIVDFDLIAWSQESRSVASGNTKCYEIGWDLALAVLIYTFDTDCSGSFDESEVRLLLQCTKCNLSERRILFHFPEVRLGSSTVENLTRYLTLKVRWNRGVFGPFGSFGRLSVSTISMHTASSMMLVSLCRQLARELARQATTLTSTGVLLEEEDSKNDGALMIRSQMLSMRQVRLYLKTSHGHLHRATELLRLKNSYRSYILSQNYSKEGLIRYAFQVHKEGRGLLITELPHIVRFMILRLKLNPNENISKIANIMESVKDKSGLRWISQEDTVILLEPLFKPPAFSFLSGLMWKTRIRLGLQGDAEQSIYSRGRQQAVLISLQFQNIAVADTNYRCCILGLEAAKKKSRQDDIKNFFRNLKILFFELRRNRDDINWYSVPREATVFLLLSRGFLMSDIMLECIKGTTGVHITGGLAEDLVDVEEVIFCSRRQQALSMNFTQKIYRWLRWFVGIPRYMEYRRVVRTILLRNADINEIGSVYLKELMSGTSHCVDDSIIPRIM